MSDAKKLAEFYHYVMFNAAQRVLSKFQSPSMVVSTVADIVSEAANSAIDEGLIKIASCDENIQHTDNMLICYSMFEELGYKFDGEVEADTPSYFRARVRSCPHEDFTKKDPLTCSACLGLKLAVVKRLTGKQPAYMVNGLNIDDSLSLEEKIEKFNKRYETIDKPNNRPLIGALQRIATGHDTCEFIMKIPEDLLKECQEKK